MASGSLGDTSKSRLVKYRESATVNAMPDRHPGEHRDQSRHVAAARSDRNPQAQLARSREQAAQSSAAKRSASPANRSSTMARNRGYFR
jgi:hypothetical protein